MKNSFYGVLEKRKKFFRDNANKDHVILNGTNSVLLSAPHGVYQVRLGKLKHNEPGSVALALLLGLSTNSYLIVKTQNNNDDANFDEDCPYRNTIESLVNKNEIKYLIDFHGMDKKRKWDINLGSHLGHNVESNVQILNDLEKELTDQGFSVAIDNPFMAQYHTISSFAKQKLGIWSLQIEINCAITNEKKNFDKFEKLVKILEKWIKSLK